MDRVLLTCSPHRRLLAYFRLSLDCQLSEHRPSSVSTSLGNSKHLQARRRIEIDGLDGNKVPLTLYMPLDSGDEALAVLVYFHGGGTPVLLPDTKVFTDFAC